MTARISHALVEIPSDEAISSTRVLTDCGSLSVMRATGSSSVRSGTRRGLVTWFGLGQQQSRFGLGSLDRDDELRVLADHAQLNRGRRQFGTDGAGGVGQAPG